MTGYSNYALFDVELLSHHVDFAKTFFKYL